MARLIPYIVTLFTFNATPLTATLRQNNAANEVQYLLELIIDSSKDSKSNLGKTLCKASGDLLPLKEYLGDVMNESGRKFLEKEATRKQIPVLNIVWFVEFLNRRQLEKKKETSFVKDVDVRELQTGYVWKVKVICNLCSPDNGDRRMLNELGSDLSTVWNAVADAVQRGIQSDCKMKNLKAVVFHKLGV